MTKIKLCGLRRSCDMEYANELHPEYIGFVFAKNSKRYVSPEEAEELRRKLQADIIPVGVFVNEPVEVIVDCLERHIIEAVQLHGTESEAYIRELRRRSTCTIIKAFKVNGADTIEAANNSSADYVLLDAGEGCGRTFDWSLIQGMCRPYFLAGGLSSDNVQDAVKRLQPFAVDASSSLETGGYKDRQKMKEFVEEVRKG